MPRPETSINPPQIPALPTVSSGDAIQEVTKLAKSLPAGYTFDWSSLSYQEAKASGGSSLLIVGFPLGFHDALHHLPVVRQAAIASSFGLRFQGLGYFLTDARTHRGTSGAPVVMRTQGTDAALPWKLLGVHSSRLDIGTRDLKLDESLGLNCAWYADILMKLED